MSRAPKATLIAAGRAALERGQAWRWRATVLRVIDGDTVEVELDLGLGLTLGPVTNVYLCHVRLLGYDAPERGTPDGVKAFEAMHELLTPWPARVWVTSAALDGRGRILGTLDLEDGRSVIDEMVKRGWLRPYSGRGPKPWPQP